MRPPPPEALSRRGWAPRHLVVGDWPAEPGLAERCNLLDLPSYAGAPLHGVIAHGAGRLEPAAFAELALRSLAPGLGGSFDAARLRPRTPCRRARTDDR